MEQFYVQIEGWITSIWEYFLTSGNDLLLGGVIVVSSVIALLGILKSLKPIKNIKNATLRKVLLSWLSIALTVVGTLISFYVSELKQDHAVSVCVINSVSTVLVYWLYENTALRSLIQALIKKTLCVLFSRKKTKDEADQPEEEKTKESLLSMFEEACYIEDDLKNL